MTAVPSQSTIPASGVRVRFAPSPTGSLHIGGAKTAMFTWLFAHGEARRQGKDGVFILRIEDTDRNRFVPGAEEGLIDALRWFGVTWDEGPDIGGPVGPYHQSERTEHYRTYAEQLISDGNAYRCYCTRDRLERVRAEQQARGEAPGYDRHCRNLSREEQAAREEGNEPYVVRFATPREGETVVHDLIRGPIHYQNVNLEDLVLLKSDGYPTYHLANVVDDHLMGITHITRGDEWIPTAPVHALLYEALGWTMPAIAHMPLILAPGGGKLSKRHGSTAVEEFRSQGYVPEALMNYLALLGWSFDASTEIFPPDELLAKFTLEWVSPSPATFDYNKLRWFNQQYINHILTLDDLTGRVIPFLADAKLITSGPSDATHPDFARVRDVVALLKDRLETLADAPDLMSFFLRDALEPYDATLLVPKKMDLQGALDALIAAEAALAAVEISDEAATEARMRALAEELGLKPGQLFMAIRVAVTGRTQSPGLFETMRVIGKDRCLARIADAIARLREHGDEAISAD
jgi:glutamyl-tRNA synthetase